MATASAAARPSLGEVFDRSLSGGIDRALGALRRHLGMDVAFVSEFADDHRFIRAVDAVRSPAPFRTGDALPLTEGYCRAVVEGRLPQLIPDTARVPAAQAIAATHDMPIGAHLSVPLLLADGRLYGTFCCFSHSPDSSLNERDLQTMRTVADLVAYRIEADIDLARERDDKRRRVQGVLDAGGPSGVYQPVFRLDDMSIAGAEALARFNRLPHMPPDRWFADAAGCGLGGALERSAIANALAGFRGIWTRGDLYLGLNCSPATILEGGLEAVMEGYPVADLVLEITEHQNVGDYAALGAALAPLRAAGVKIAIDDAGSGYASLRHILNIEPDIIKLDISLTRGIDADRMKRAMARALIAFGNQTGSSIVAEGVETAAEMETLREIGVQAAQGYHLAHPLSQADLLARLPETLPPAADLRRR